jgi:hypothetical protein
MVNKLSSSSVLSYMLLRWAVPVIFCNRWIVGTILIAFILGCFALWLVELVYFWIFPG